MITLNTAWYIYYGKQLQMSRQEVMVTRIGEMQDLIACLSICNGAPLKEKPRCRDFVSTMGVR